MSADLTRTEREELLILLEERRRRQDQRLFFSLYPETDSVWPGSTIMKGLVTEGQLLHAREKYPRHLEFFRAGASFRERCAMCANRVGKTFGMGGYETAAHLTGLYPDWWEGRRFATPISAWAAGKKNETTRDILQLTLLGQVAQDGSRKGLDGRGVIPGHLLSRPTWKQGVQDLVDTIKVRHVSGGWSVLGFKSFDQGRGAFEGTAQHVVWLDEEPPMDVYGEVLIRTATTRGIVMITFTPLEGMSEVVMQFLPSEMRLSEK
ncbi:phage terminase large subunit-like protein [Azospirillum agricola]|uniref:terminase large subunit domain-containing protein n=1 Tax=Azospirillum agricola TaxID=1720247 RepID=UPI001AEAE460|nr:terminase family protein [Azospirillum agricola]MBP2230812.1 phage terminase large subunit-like protein [Azospirillum agricola]